MATELELALFQEELETVRNLPESIRWKLERDGDVPLGLFVELHPRSSPTESYKARLRWEDYFGPVSLKFINIVTGLDNDPTAWPRCPGFRPASFDACLPWTAEGHALHPEWRKSAVNRFPNVDLPMQYALFQVQFALDNTYEGRGSK